MDTNQAQLEKEFLLKEVEQVRKNYDEFIEETRRLERYAIFVTGVIWSWCASHTDSFAFSLLIWFPSFACALFGLRAAGVHFQARAARQYIANVETIFNLTNQLGWANTQLKNSTGVPAIVAVTAYVFWAIIGIGTTAIPLIYRSHIGG